MLRHSLFVTLILLAVSTAADAQEPRVSFRAGLSNVSGILAAEAQIQHVALSIGWLPNVGTGGANVDNWPLRMVFAVRGLYYTNSSGPMVNLTLITNDVGYVTSPAATRPTKTFPILGLSAGYRFMLKDFMLKDNVDVSVGVGIGNVLGLDEIGKRAEVPARRLLVDLTIGFSL